MAGDTVVGKVLLAGANILVRRRKRIRVFFSSHRDLLFYLAGQSSLQPAGRASLASSERQRQGKSRIISATALAGETCRYSTTVMVMFMLPWFVPQKWSQMVVKLPAVSGVRATSVGFPGSITSSIFNFFM